MWITSKYRSNLRFSVCRGPWLYSHSLWLSASNSDQNEQYNNLTRHSTAGHTGGVISWQPACLIIRRVVYTYSGCVAHCGNSFRKQYIAVGSLMLPVLWLWLLQAPWMLLVLLLWSEHLKRVIRLTRLWIISSNPEAATAFAGLGTRCTHTITGLDQAIILLLRKWSYVKQYNYVHLTDQVEELLMTQLAPIWGSNKVTRHTCKSDKVTQPI